MLNDHPEICCDGEPLLRLGRSYKGQPLDARRGAFDAVLENFARGKPDDVLKPCKKPGALARGFKWFDGQAGVNTTQPDAVLKDFKAFGGAVHPRRASRVIFRLTQAWLAKRKVRLLVLERQGLDKLVSDRLKHLSTLKGTQAVPTHCHAANAGCVGRVNAQRLTLRGDVAAELRRSREAFAAFLGWCRAASSDLLSRAARNA